MKSSLCFLSAAALAVFPGCVIVGDRVDPGEPLDASFELTWSIEHDGSHAVLSCFDAAADTVRVKSHNVDTGDVAIDLFDCGANSGRTAPLDAGQYAVDVDLLD